MSFGQQGSVLIGASSDIGNNPIIFWQLTPSVGYFLTDNICLGLGLGITSQAIEPNDDVKQENDSMSLTPFLRYYLNDKHLFFHAGIGIGSASSIYDDENFGKNESTTSTFGITAGVGYSLNWGKYFVFEPILSLKNSSGSTTSKYTDISGCVIETDSDAPSTLGIGISLGISIILGN